MYIGILSDSHNWKVAKEELGKQEPIIFGAVKPSPFSCLDVDMKNKKYVHIVECESIVNGTVNNPKQITCYSKLVYGGF